MKWLYLTGFFTGFSVGAGGVLAGFIFHRFN